MNLIQKFLLICSGSNVKVLKKTPTEWNKHAGMGGVILFTALFAAISGSYALFTIFDNLPMAVGFGLLWGLMIFNLDRYIVSTLKSDAGPWRSFFQALPRFILAVFLGVVISKPLELKIFEKEIDKQLNVIINRNKLQLQDSINLRYNSLTSNYSTERNQLNKQLKDLEDQYNQASLDLEKEIIGTQTETTSGKQGYGPNAKRKAELKQQKFQAIQEFKALNKKKLDSLETGQSNILKNKEKEIAGSDKVENRYNGILARLQALSELTKGNSTMHWASLFIMGIFIMLEVSPVLIKLISPKGGYDELMRWKEFQTQTYAEEHIQKEKHASLFRINRHKNNLDKEEKENLSEV